MNELIGGHPGMQVWRTDQGILKIADGVERNNVAGLQNEARMLRLMEGTAFAPRLLAEHGFRPGERFSIMEEDVGPTLQQGVAPKDSVRFRRNCTYLLLALRERGIRHGDLTTTNLALRQDDIPVALDWQESRRFDEVAEDKQPHSDSYLLWERLAAAGLDSDRLMRRWMAVLADLGGDVGTENLKGKRLLDLGCYQGDFCGLAAAEGMVALGVDRDTVAIDEARRLWRGQVNFLPSEITDLGDVGWLFRADGVLLFSTWPYIFRDHGRQVADRLIAELVAHSGCLYFETQLAGDGPGPLFLGSDEDVRDYLGQFGEPTPLVTIPVAGRPANRTVWRVVKTG